MYTMTFVLQHIRLPRITHSLDVSHLALTRMRLRSRFALTCFAHVSQFCLRLSRSHDGASTLALFRYYAHIRATCFILL